MSSSADCFYVVRHSLFAIRSSPTRSVQGEQRIANSERRFLIHLGHLRQHGTSLGADRDVLIRLRHPGQHGAHIAVGFHRLYQSQGQHPDARVRVADQRPQNSIAHSLSLPHKATHPVHRGRGGGRGGGGGEGIEGGGGGRGGGGGV